MSSSYRWLGLGCTFALAAAVFAWTAFLASKPSRPASRLGLRGLKRQRALKHTPGWSTIEPLVRWLGVRISGAMSDRIYDRIDRQLVLAGDVLGLTPPEYLALGALSFGGGIALGAIAARVTHMGGLIMAAVALFGAALPYIAVSGEAEQRLKRIRRGLPYAIDLVALAMSAGLDFPGAIRQVLDKSSDPNDPLVEELAWMLQKMHLGATRRQVLEEFAERAPIEVVLEFVGAVVQAEERGNPVAKVLQIQATASRQRRSVMAEESAAKAGVALSAPLVLLFLSILLLIMAPIVIRLSQSALFTE